MRIARVLALSALTLTAVPAAAQQASPREQSITVTGNRNQDYRDRLAACLARRCPVNEDVDATLALAEALFLGGDYNEARSAVLASLRRNRDAAASFPEPVSDLFRVQGRLARHIGLDREARTATSRILNALQAGIPREDHRHFTARFEIAEVKMMSGDFEGARRELVALAEAARGAGRPDVVVMAELREAAYQLIAFPADGRDRLQGWAALTAPADRLRAIGARVILSRHYRARGDTARADALIAELGRTATTAGARRRLLYSPSYTLAQQEVRQAAMDNDRLVVSNAYSLHRQLADHMDDAWIDVGFWIAPDGRVSGLEILRHGADTAWTRPLLEAIGRRVYSTGTEATYRLERYTMTAGFDVPTGTRLRRRGPDARVEYLDLTEGTRPPGPPPPSGGRPTA